MKMEIMDIEGKGRCIVIYDINPYDFVNKFTSSTSPFNDIHVIAHEIKRGRKIGAIKEIRYQTGWGLKEAKEYADKYVPIGNNIPDVCERAASRFIQDHMPKDFLNDNDFSL